MASGLTPEGARQLDEDRGTEPAAPWSLSQLLFGSYPERDYRGVPEHLSPECRDAVAVVADPAATNPHADVLAARSVHRKATGKVSCMDDIFDLLAKWTERAATPEYREALEADQQRDQEAAEPITNREWCRAVPIARKPKMIDHPVTFRGRTFTADEMNGAALEAWERDQAEYNRRTLTPVKPGSPATIHDRILRAIEGADPLSGSAIARLVRGSKKAVLDALNDLHADNLVERQRGGRGAYLWTRRNGDTSDRFPRDRFDRRSLSRTAPDAGAWNRASASPATEKERTA